MAPINIVGPIIFNFSTNCFYILFKGAGAVSPPLGLGLETSASDLTTPASDIPGSPLTDIPDTPTEPKETLDMSSLSEVMNGVFSATHSLGDAPVTSEQAVRVKPVPKVFE